MAWLRQPLERQANLGEADEGGDGCRTAGAPAPALRADRFPVIYLTLRRRGYDFLRFALCAGRFQELVVVHFRRFHQLIVSAFRRMDHGGVEEKARLSEHAFLLKFVAPVQIHFRQGDLRVRLVDRRLLLVSGFPAASAAIRNSSAAAKKWPFCIWSMASRLSCRPLPPSPSVSGCTGPTLSVGLMALPRMPARPMMLDASPSPAATLLAPEAGAGMTGTLGLGMQRHDRPGPSFSEPSFLPGPQKVSARPAPGMRASSPKSAGMTRLRKY